MGPSRHTRAAAAASAAAGGASSSRLDNSPSTALTTSAAQSRTSTRASPYTRTPTKQSSSLSVVGPSTPTSRTSSPMMLREIFSMISPFRGHSRAKRSAAFGGADEVEEEEQQPNAAVQSTQEDDDVKQAVDTEDRMIEDAEEGASGAIEQTSTSTQLDVPTSSRTASRSPSPRPRSSLAAPKSLPLADSALVTPGLRRQIASTQHGPMSSTPLPSTSYAPQTQTSPVSRNYDLLARFFSEKQCGSQGGLTEVEVEGCIRLIEESMATGRNLESEFASSLPQARHHATMPSTNFAPSSRASSIAPPAMPASQTMSNLFHPGTAKLPPSTSTFSFLAPRAGASSTGHFGAPAPATRRRPIYLGPGMSGLSLNRRRPVVASASRASALKTQAQSFMPRSMTDPNFMRHTEDAEEERDASARAEESKRRRTGADAGPQSATSASDRPVQFAPAYEKQAQESSLLAKDLASSPSKAPSLGSVLKRLAPEADAAAAKTSPPKPATRTASAIQDILKTTPPVRPPTKPELVNPYQSAVPLPPKSKKASEEAPSTPVRRSARTSMLTRAKARETAKAADKNSPPKESVLDLIERTAPKTSKRKATTEAADPQRTSKADAAPQPVAAPAASEPSAEERKLQKTEEVQRRLEALKQAKAQEQQKPAAPKPAASLVPPQYAATKPKKPSPLSAGFQAPDSPSSDSEAATFKPSDPSIAQPNFSFGAGTAAPASSPAPAAAKVAPPSSGFSFSAPKPSGAQPASSGGFSFSKPEPAAAPASAAAPAPAASTGFSFTPVTSSTSMAAAKPATSAPAPAPASGGFSFSAPAPAPASAASSAAAKDSQREEVAKEDASKLPHFAWQFTPAETAASAGGADKALREEIKSVAQAALPKFDFIYEIETSAEKQGGPSKTASTTATAAAPAASTGGFSFSAPAKATGAAPVMGGFSFSATPPAPSPAPASAAAAESTQDTAADEGADTSTPQASGLLGEGEGEESETTLLTTRAKIWRLDTATKAWKDLGVCIAKLKVHKETGKHRLLARNEANGKVAVNFMTYKGLKCALDKTVNSLLGFDEGKPVQLRVKTKTEDQAKEFKLQLEEAGGKS